VDDVDVSLAVVEQFLNTLDERTFSSHGEKHVASGKLTSAGALSAWLEEHGLATAGPELLPSDLTAAVALRGALREALAGDADGARAAQALAGFPCDWCRTRLAGCAWPPTAAWPALTSSSRRWPRAWPAATGAA
jgi:hypothetical protein